MGSPRFRRQVETFLSANALRLESVEDYFCILREDGSIAAGAGLSGDLIKCVAVDSAERSRGLLAPLLSHVIAYASEKGVSNLKVFTKPENEAVFTSLGFHTIAKAPLAILMENSHGLEDYLTMLGEIAVSGLSPGLASPDRSHPRLVRGRGPLAERVGGAERSEESGLPEPGDRLTTLCAGVIVMNANPFTLGHKYLVEKAAEQVERLFVIPVKEDLSLFPYSERLEMIKSGCEGMATVLDGSDYQISAATFPTYFLKDLSEASETQMLLDLDLFGRHIAPALGATVRFVGSEPTDQLTARYNDLMKQVLPQYGVSVVEIPRLEISKVAVGLRLHSAAAIRASDVRKALNEGSFHTAAALTPPSTWPYLVAELMARALKMELDTPMKPGLVDKDSNGAHSDMDYALMSGSIEVIRRSFIRHLPMDYCLQSGSEEYRHSDASLRSAPPLASQSEAPVPPSANQLFPLKSPRGHLPLRGVPRVAWSESAVLLRSDVNSIREFGRAIEADVMEYTGGVNTYRGAIFALGLASLSALDIARDSQLGDYQVDKPMCLVDNNQAISANLLIDNTLCFTAAKLSDRIANLSGQIAPGKDSHGANAVKEYGVKGALQLAQEGYKSLFEDWLPFYRRLAYAGSPSAVAAGLRPYSAAASEAKREWTRPCPDSTADKTPDSTADKTPDSTADQTPDSTADQTPDSTADQTLQKTLLRIMSTLDDTCVIHRVGYERAQEVKKEAEALLDNFSEEGLREMKKRYDAEGISPGGAADMLALTILIDSLTN
ncbi:MAG: GNAT family N-acetyltransferase [Bacteroidales bacterium]|nr:GNAT family N-acetyltransferase [Bacteroidales bacterium]